MGFGKYLRLILAYKNMSISDLATLMGTSQQNISNKIRRDNFTEKDIQLISEKLGVKAGLKIVVDRTFIIDEFGSIDKVERPPIKLNKLKKD